MKRFLSILSLGTLILILGASGCSPATSSAPPTSQATAAPTATDTPLPTPSPEATPTERPTAEPTATEIPEGEENGADPEDSTAGETNPGTWTADGVISEGEYEQQEDFGEIRIWWRNDASSLYLALEGDTTGWVAVGLNPQNGMEGADYVFGYVVNGEAQLWDAWGTAPRGPNHPPDEDLGGANDIVAFAGVEENDVTRLEVQKPLDSGDAYDHALEPGSTYPIIIAIGGEDEFDAYHLTYERGEITLSAAP